MKAHFVLLALAAGIISACGSSGSTEIEDLREERDSLKGVKSEVAARIADLENMINELDSNYDKRLPIVATMGLNQTRFEHFFEVQGTVETDQNAQIFPEAPGRITSISVKEGQKVSKGQTLMTIDSRVLRNQIEEMKSRYELTKIVYKKQEKLWSQKIGSEIQYLEAKNNRDAMKNSLEALEAQLDMYTVKAPFAGVVDEVFPKAGEMANPAMPACRMLNLDKVYIKADVSESYLGKIGKGDSVNIYFPSLGQRVNTSISRIGSYINPNNRTFKVTLDINNDDNLLKPNLLGEINIMDYAADSAVVIPSSLILENTEGKNFVMVLTRETDGRYTAQQRPIETGMSYEGMTHVMAGLDGAEKLITKGARSVKAGEEVEVSDEKQASL